MKVSSFCCSSFQAETNRLDSPSSHVIALSLPMHWRSSVSSTKRDGSLNWTAILQRCQRSVRRPNGHLASSVGVPDTSPQPCNMLGRPCVLLTNRPTPNGLPGLFYIRSDSASNADQWTRLWPHYQK